jgi:hypothetical protein
MSSEITSHFLSSGKYMRKQKIEEHDAGQNEHLLAVSLLLNKIISTASPMVHS